MKYQKKLVRGVGVFCVNVCTGRGKYSPLRIMWCGGCYKDNPRDEFLKSSNESGVYL